MDAIDSQNVLAALLGDSEHGNEYIIEDAAELALRHNNWKYIGPRLKKEWRPVVKPALFDLDADIGESTNLLKKYPERAEAMAAKLDQFIKTQIRETEGKNRK